MTSILTDVAQFATGNFHTCAVLRDSSVRCWGANYSGELGPGISGARGTPQVVAGLTGVVSVTAGGSDVCAVMTDASVKCWGKNNYGQLGDGTVVSRSTIQPVPGLTNVAMMAAGDRGARQSGHHLRAEDRRHRVVLGSERLRRCWRRNEDPATLARPAHDAQQCDRDRLGRRQSCAMHANGSLSCWGQNYYGAVGVGTNGVNTTCFSPLRSCRSANTRGRANRLDSRLGERRRTEDGGRGSRARARAVHAS